MVVHYLIYDGNNHVRNLREARAAASNVVMHRLRLLGEVQYVYATSVSFSNLLDLLKSPLGVTAITSSIYERQNEVQWTSNVVMIKALTRTLYPGLW